MSLGCRVERSKPLLASQKRQEAAIRRELATVGFPNIGLQGFAPKLTAFLNGFIGMVDAFASALVAKRKAFGNGAVLDIDT